ncbi:isoprenylcysteine carboxyl methyltransferase family protein [Minwuia sp.]|uniref:isoprenylcysteine carboxyl methyltransferase family protein n=1 Tax=Minwuia sp. TaxID=2493630 RepID=UPI003A916D09
MTVFHVVLAALIVQRLAELWLANRNTRRLLADGATEHGRAHYPLFVLLHTSWIAALIWFAPADAEVNPVLLIAFVLLQGGRIWVISTLGRYWTTRVINVPDAPVITGGPYRFVRHPNYLVVIGEIAVVPLMVGLWQIALVFSILNLMLIAWRIRIEDRALQDRRDR